MGLWVCELTQFWKGSEKPGLITSGLWLPDLELLQLYRLSDTLVVCPYVFFIGTSFQRSPWAKAF